MRECLRLVGIAKDDKVDCPLNRCILADALGLSPIPINRVLRQLREQNLMTLKDRTVVIEVLRGVELLVGDLDH